MKILESKEIKEMMCTSEVKLKSESKRRFDEYDEEEVKKLKRKLTHLEKETNLMKQELSHNIAERKTMLNDVYQQLKLVHFSIRNDNQPLGYKFCEGGRSDGLSQVLYEDWNPSLVTRGGSGINSVADHSPAESVVCITNSNR